MNHQKYRTFSVTLRRRDPSIAWGVRIVGGADLSTSIVITRVQPGSPSEKNLFPGDIITKIEDYDARDISHHDAMRLFLNAGTTIKLDIKRDPNTRMPRMESFGFELKSTGDWKSKQQEISLPPKPTLGGGNFLPSIELYHGDEVSSIAKQPYRTTPLVLPGAKAKHEKELAPTESYLRHHPNPTMRAAPSQYELLPQEVVMKQKVADSVLQRVVGDEAFSGKQVIHRQFNTPIGLYSNQNILDTIHHQTGISPSGVGCSSFTGKVSSRNPAPKRTVVYDPAKSETFKALQEEQYGGQQVQEVTVPAQPKVFAPGVHGKKVQHQAPQAHTYDPLSRSTSSPGLQHHLPYVNSMGHSEERIAQSGSFKRLMNMVLAQSE